MQTIKDVNQSLIDDFLVLSDKIGAGNFFWSFPSKLYEDQIVLQEKQKKSICIVESNIDELKSLIEKEKQFRCSFDRDKHLKKLQESQEKEQQLDKQLENLKHNDPVEVR